VLPRLAAQVETLFGATLEWSIRAQPLLDHTVQPYQALLTRIDPKAIAAMLAAGKTG
jgi:methionyl-tRNA synthetase